MAPLYFLVGCVLATILAYIFEIHCNTFHVDGPCGACHTTAKLGIWRTLFLRDATVVGFSTKAVANFANVRMFKRSSLILT